jgi:branched-chain amino acid aminotransferase
MAGVKSVLINGVIREHLPVNFALENRAFLLGDGFFETIRVIDGRVFNWDAHYNRIHVTASTLNIDMPSVYTSEFFLDSIRKLLVQNEILGGGRLRMTFFREGQGAYASDSNKLGFVAHVIKLPQRTFQVGDKGLHIAVFPNLQKNIDSLANFKLLGNQVYMQAASWSQKNNIDEALIANTKGYLIETTSCNLFIVRNGKIHTPPLKQGCVAGTMRMAVINAAIRMGIEIFETNLTEEDVLFADEVFLTNAIQGVSWVGSFKQKRYYHKLSDQLISKIRERQEISI